MYRTQRKSHKSETAAIAYALNHLKLAASTRRQLMADASTNRDRSHSLQTASAAMREESRTRQSKLALLTRAKDELAAQSAQIKAEIREVQV